MKIAADYGFKVENDGLANARALQSAVEGGGDVYIDQPGVYELADQILLDDDTSLYFCAGAYVKRVNNPEENGYVFVNRGAYTKTYNHNIQIIGLHLICDEVRSVDKEKNSQKVVLGLRGHCSFFYIKNWLFEISSVMICPWKISVFTSARSRTFCWKIYVSRG